MSKEIFNAALQLNNADQLAITGLIEAAAKLANAGEPALAHQLYRAWIERNENHPQLYVACFNCATLDGIYLDQAAAAASLQRAIKQNPDFIPAYINLGRIYEDCGNTEQALELWRMATSRHVPMNGSTVQYMVTAFTQMARVLTAQQKSEEAEIVVKQCLDINPHQPEIVEQYTALLLAQCKWPIAVSTEHFDRKMLLGGINPLSMAAYTDDPLFQLGCAYRYVKRASWDGPHNMQSDRRDAAIDLSGRRLRIGYVSSDLRDHAIGYLMAELFELHNKKDVEVFAYYCGPASNSALTHRIKAAVEHWVDVKDMSDDEAAKRVAADGIDILVDVNGHTRDSKTGMFARYCAPIQVNWLGYPGTMASPYHQYIIADEWIIPPEMELYYSEKVARLPCYQPNDRKRIIAPEPPTRTSAGLPDNAFVFCCFNGTHKISRFTFERWMDVLGKVDNSVLWLLDSSDQTKKRLREVAEKRGIAGDRLVFAPKLANTHHLARYPLADLFLDSTPYGAHTTASDALWMGVPVLTLSGRSFASRVCGSLVRSAGVGDLVYTDADAYVARAIELAGKPKEIEAYKARLRANRDTCTLFDTAKLVSSLEQLYRGMVEEHRKGQVPQPDLANLEAYFNAGVEHDHDNLEVLKVADYHGLYRSKLKRYHRARPLAADSRIWGRAEIAAADGRTSAEVTPLRVAANDVAGDIEALRQSARMMNAQGRTLECLEALLALKVRGAAEDILIHDIRPVIDPTIQGFNQALAAGDLQKAVLFADALAALLPGNVAALNSALTCNVALGRKQLAERYAASLIDIEPTHAAARDVLAKQAEPAMAQPLHPLVQVRDLYDEASHLLCGAFSDKDAQQVKQLLAKARKIEIDAPAGSDIEAWEKHYRLALKAIDMNAALGDTPEASKDSKPVFVSAAGRAMDWNGVQNAAKTLKAKAVFFAAADKVYVDLYGRAYIDSILEHADVSSLIVLHVAGGAKGLPKTAKELGIASNRLIFAGDNFDAAAIKTKCFDAPPKGQSKLPIAHLQSVRFMRAGALLSGLKLPVLVSDIDMVLQRGVADLLEKFKNHDFVLNENDRSDNAGSRFTANLLLLNPTKNTAQFLRFLRAFLEKALGGSEVSRWIDQFGLMQARHHLMRQQPKAAIGYFDVNSDVNNVMYPAWQENPFRFLSLYHGFDMSSLPAKTANKSNLRTLTPAQKKKASPASRAGARRANG